MSLSLPNDFQNEMKIQLKEEYPDFINALNQIAPTSIRINPSKNYVVDENLEKIDWCENSFYLQNRPIFTLDPTFHAGGYYVQEAASMWISKIIENEVDLSKPLKVLDLCAAPGGKSTLLLGLISKESLIICNEVIKSRSHILKENLIKWGNSNVIVSNHDVEDFKGFENYFDIILVDAPCSGEGMFRKDPNSILEWSIDNVENCSSRQKNILKHTFPLVKNGGILIYCTCTYNNTENENSAQYIQESNQFKPLIINDSRLVDKGIGYQCYPHKVKGEGFYFAAFSKLNQDDNYFKTITSFKQKKWLDVTKIETNIISNWVENAENFTFKKNYDGIIYGWLKIFDNDLEIIEKALKRWSPILEIGSIKGNDLIPAHSLALSNYLSAKIQNIDVDKINALKFLKKETFILPQGKLGWNTISYKNLKLGWVKNLGNRFNNYLPNSSRIIMNIDYELIIK